MASKTKLKSIPTTLKNQFTEKKKSVWGRSPTGNPLNPQF